VREKLPDLIWLDMMLRQESGPEVLSSLKKGEEQVLFRELSRSRPQEKTGPLLTRRPV